MTRREQVLAICVAGALGSVALIEGVQYVVVKPFQNVDQSIRDQQSERTQLKKRLASMKNIDERWTDLTKRTLATDPREAGRRFQRDMNELAELHGLRNPKITSSNPTTYKNGFIGVPLTLSAEGTLKDAVGFLNDFYRRDYIARLDKVTLASERSVIDSVNSARRQRSTATTARNRGRHTTNNNAATPAPAAATPAASNVVMGPEGPMLKINVTAVTLVLPEIKGLDHPIAENLKDGTGRLDPNLNKYTEILDNSLFKPYQPPAPPVAAVTPPREETPKPETPAKVVDVPQPIQRPTNLFVTCTTSLDGRPVAYILDETAKDPNEVLTKVYEDDPIDDGTLLLIHNNGLVVRVKEGRRVKDYFYPLGSNFADREDLDRDTHPDVWQAMQDEFYNWDGGGEPLGTAASPAHAERAPDLAQAARPGDE